MGASTTRFLLARRLQALDPHQCSRIYERADFGRDPEALIGHYERAARFLCTPVVSEMTVEMNYRP